MNKKIKSWTFWGDTLYSLFHVTVIQYYLQLEVERFLMLCRHENFSYLHLFPLVSLKVVLPQHLIHDKTIVADSAPGPRRSP